MNERTRSSGFPRKTCGMQLEYNLNLLRRAPPDRAIPTHPPCASVPRAHPRHERSAAAPGTRDTLAGNSVGQSCGHGTVTHDRLRRGLVAGTCRSRSPASAGCYYRRSVILTSAATCPVLSTAVPERPSHRHGRSPVPFAAAPIRVLLKAAPALPWLRAIG